MPSDLTAFECVGWPDGSCRRFKTDEWGTAKHEIARLIGCGSQERGAAGGAAAGPDARAAPGRAGARAGGGPRWSGGGLGGAAAAPAGRAPGEGRRTAGTGGPGSRRRRRPGLEQAHTVARCSATHPQDPRLVQGQRGLPRAFVASEGFVVLKGYVVARGDVAIALGILQYAGLATVVTAGLLSSLPILAAAMLAYTLARVFARVLTRSKEQLRRPSPGPCFG